MPKPLRAQYQVRCKNYKCFADTSWLTLRPLTILTGPNNSGKSSIISPLLMMRQTVMSPDAAPALITSGPLRGAGGHRNFAHRNELDRDVFFVAWPDQARQKCLESAGAPVAYSNLALGGLP